MKSIALWNALRARFGGRSPQAHHLVVQHLMLAERDQQAVRAALDQLGAALGLRLELQGHAGEIVLLDADLEARVTPQLMQSLVEDRPVLELSALAAPLDPTSPAAVECRRAELHRQLLRIELVRCRSSHPEAAHWRTAPDTPQAPASGFDAEFDTVLDAQQLASTDFERGPLALLQQVLRGMRLPATPALAASYGTDAHLRFDFKARLVSFDPLALQHLRVRRELPQAAAGTEPGHAAIVREMDEVLWDLGLASGAHPLADAPADWWHTPVRCRPQARIERYSRVPRHLAMARRLAAGPVSPSQLRREAGVGVAELRRFLQACLLLRLVHWSAAEQMQEAA